MNLLVEFEKSYQGTYFQVTYENRLLPFFLSEANKLSLHLNGSILKSNTGPWIPISIPFNIDSFELAIPTLGLVNTISKDNVKTAYVLSQIPERQWKKGLYERNIRSSKLAVLEEKLTKTILINEPGFLWNVFNPTYYKLSEFNAAKDISMALSPRFGVINSKGSPIITFDGYHIGYEENNEVILLRAFSHLQDLIRKFHYCKVE